MKTKKIGAFLFGAATLVILSYTIYKIIVGKEVGFNEIITISSLLMIFLSTITWGSKEDQDGILQEEELGQKITEESSKISYYILLLLILTAVIADKFINGTTNIFLLILLGLAMVILPLVEYFIAKKYQ